MADISIYDVINDIVVTVPGVISFANSKAKSEEEILTKDITRAIELSSSLEFERVKIHVVLINGISIRDVLSEIQTRVKYELEKASKFMRNYIVDVVVDDIHIA
ncbi:Asp23/Gls24 family envelope stress response protein [Spiroplasma tabanidicola]|uniref:Asp23/Gls24 family envelope stress response protein n=1 Tax=Spiroplasma tabanidicola TaxID=324079 RepID=A0A6I6CDN2_9MOLU|nr:Asp23/Gls24 family envelope stress response protein [Spiroplasma tabanidicola]QGS52232.1 Asp23/Gls24 family envelope stress response protein [Spiroplasma tabanidicola]